MSVFRVKAEPGKEPSDWKVEKFADTDGNEMFIRHVGELRTIVDATLIFGQQREDVKSAIMSILTDGLMPAFNELEKIRASKEKRMPLMDERELYHGFYGKLWKAYKELTQRAAKSADFKIGFLFANDIEFAKGLIDFRANYPAVRSELDKALAETRVKWQNELCNFRNTVVEHPDADATAFKKFYRPDFSELLFMEVWNTIVDLLAVLLDSRLAGGTRIGLPDLKKYPKWTNRFMLYNAGLKINNS